MRTNQGSPALSVNHYTDPFTFKIVDARQYIASISQNLIKHIILGGIVTVMSPDSKPIQLGTNDLQLAGSQGSIGRLKLQN